MSKIDDCLKARGCTLAGEVGKVLHSFALTGERVPGGRFLVRPNGDVELWHVRAANGLNLGAPWSQAGTKAVNAGQVPVYKANLRDLEVRPGLDKLSFAPRPQPVLTVAPDAAVREAAADLLASMGWKYKGRSGSIELWNDGTGSTPACRMFVRDGMASVWSFRGDLVMPAPWRPGRVTGDGQQTYYVTGRDLGLAGDVTLAPRSSPAPADPRRGEVNKDLIELIKESWHAGVPVPPDHRHLTKSGVRLDSAGLRVFPDTPENREKHFAGDILIPLFRPASDDAKWAVEVCGAQRLMKSVWQNTDKLLLPGSKPTGAFVPLPIPDSLLRPGPGRLGNIEDWERRCDKSKPLVICEGVATGLAIQQSGAGNVLCAISSNNLPQVAKWVQKSGLADQFPDVVIAADYDVGRRHDDRLRSAGILKAMEAAVVVDGKVALAPAGSPVGCDARDLLARGGEEAVRQYVEDAVPPREILNRGDRGDVFPQRGEREQETELER